MPPRPLTQQGPVVPAAVAIVHLPPPVHGLAVASRTVVDQLQVAAPGRVVVADIGGSLQPTLAQRLRRFWRIVRAAAVLVRRRRCRRLYLACDGGSGVVFTAVLLELAARLRYETHLHHHSLAHVRPPHGLAPRALAGVARRHRGAVVHVGACASMVEEIADAYGPGARTFVLPLHQVADAPGRSSAPSDARRPLVLGHLSNLTEAKGLATVFDVLAAGVSAGLDLQLLVAGPVHAASDRAILERGLRDAGGRARWLGAVDGVAKRSFFDQIDVFLFPSRYRHESFAVVVAEAQAAGRPVLAFRAGCLDREVFGDGVETLPVEADFVEEAVDRARAWATDPARLRRDGQAAIDRAAVNRAAAATAVAELAEAIVA